MVRLVVVMSALGAILASSQYASAQATKPDCFHVSYANQGDFPATAMRWNSCTGETWLLLRSPDTDKDGKPDGATFGWFPVILNKIPATSAN